MFLPIGSYLLFTMHALCYGCTQCFWVYLVVYDHRPMHFCKALSWKSLWIKAPDKLINVSLQGHKNRKKRGLINIQGFLLSYARLPGGACHVASIENEWKTIGLFDFTRCQLTWSSECWLDFLSDLRRRRGLVTVTYAIKVPWDWFEHCWLCSRAHFFGEQLHGF